MKFQVRAASSAGMGWCVLPLGWEETEAQSTMEAAEQWIRGHQDLEPTLQRMADGGSVTVQVANADHVWEFALRPRLRWVASVSGSTQDRTPTKNMERPVLGAQEEAAARPGPPPAPPAPAP